MGWSSQSTVISLRSSRQNHAHNPGRIAPCHAGRRWGCTNRSDVVRGDETTKYGSGFYVCVIVSLRSLMNVHFCGFSLVSVYPVPSHETGWEKTFPDDLTCVQWDVKPQRSINQSINQQVHRLRGRPYIHTCRSYAARFHHRRISSAAFGPRAHLTINRTSL